MLSDSFLWHNQPKEGRRISSQTYLDDIFPRWVIRRRLGNRLLRCWLLRCSRLLGGGGLLGGTRLGGTGSFRASWGLLCNCSSIRCRRSKRGWKRGRHCWDGVSGCVENDGGGDKESCVRALRAPRPRDFISVDGTERVASRVRSSCGPCCLLIAKPYLHPHSHRPFPPYKTAPASGQQFSAPIAQGKSRNPSKSCDEAGSDDMEFRVNSHRYTSTYR